MKIKVLKDTMASGKKLRKGKVATVSDEDGKLLVRMKRASLVGAKEPAEKKEQPKE